MNFKKLSSVLKKAKEGGRKNVKKPLSEIEMLLKLMKCSNIEELKNKILELTDNNELEGGIRFKQTAGEAYERVLKMLLSVFNQAKLETERLIPYEYKTTNDDILYVDNLLVDNPLLAGKTNIAKPPFDFIVFRKSAPATEISNAKQALNYFFSTQYDGNLSSIFKFFNETYSKNYGAISLFVDAKSRQERTLYDAEATYTMKQISSQSGIPYFVVGMITKDDTEVDFTVEHFQSLLKKPLDYLTRIELSSSMRPAPLIIDNPVNFINDYIDNIANLKKMPIASFKDKFNPYLNDKRFAKKFTRKFTYKTRTEEEKRRFAELTEAQQAEKLKGELAREQRAVDRSREQAEIDRELLGRTPEESARLLAERAQAQAAQADVGYIAPMTAKEEEEDRRRLEQQEADRVAAERARYMSDLQAAKVVATLNKYKGVLDLFAAAGKGYAVMKDLSPKLLVKNDFFKANKDTLKLLLSPSLITDIQNSVRTRDKATKDLATLVENKIIQNREKIQEILNKEIEAEQTERTLQEGREKERKETEEKVNKMIDDSVIDFDTKEKLKPKVSVVIKDGRVVINRIGKREKIDTYQSLTDFEIFLEENRNKFIMERQAKEREARIQRETIEHQKALADASVREAERRRTIAGELAKPYASDFPSVEIPFGTDLSTNAKIKRYLRITDSDYEILTNRNCNLFNVIFSVYNLPKSINSKIYNIVVELLMMNNYTYTDDVEEVFDRVVDNVFQYGTVVYLEKDKKFSAGSVIGYFRDIINHLEPFVSHIITTVRHFDIYDKLIEYYMKYNIGTYNEKIHKSIEKYYITQRDSLIFVAIDKSRPRNDQTKFDKMLESYSESEIINVIMLLFNLVSRGKMTLTNIELKGLYRNTIGLTGEASDLLYTNAHYYHNLLEADIINLWKEQGHKISSYLQDVYDSKRKEGTSEIMRQLTFQILAQNFFGLKTSRGQYKITFLNHILILQLPFPLLLSIIMEVYSIYYYHRTEHYRDSGKMIYPLVDKQKDFLRRNLSSKIASGRTLDEFEDLYTVSRGDEKYIVPRIYSADHIDILSFLTYEDNISCNFGFDIKLENTGIVDLITDIYSGTDTKRQEVLRRMNIEIYDRIFWTVPIELPNGVSIKQSALEQIGDREQIKISGEAITAFVKKPMVSTITRSSDTSASASAQTPTKSLKDSARDTIRAIPQAPLRTPSDILERFTFKREGVPVSSLDQLTAPQRELFEDTFSAIRQSSNSDKSDFIRDNLLGLVERLEFE